MGNKDWENYLRDMVSDFKSKGEPSPREEFAQHLNHPDSPIDAPEPSQDQLLKETLSDYSPPGEVQGWDRIAASLDAADKEFDKQLRERISEFKPQPDPHSWPDFINHFSAHKLLRAKLIALKVFETAALVLLLITVLHLNHLGKLPFLTPYPGEAGQNQPITLQSPEMADDVNSPLTTIAETDQANNFNAEQAQVTHRSISSQKSNLRTPDISLPLTADDLHLSVPSTASLQEEALLAFDFPVIIENEVSDELPAAISLNEYRAYSTPFQLEDSGMDEPNPAIESEKEHLVQARNIYPTTALTHRTNSLQSVKADPIPDPVFVKIIEKSFLEFGMLAQVDYNQLKMPEDYLYSTGQQVVFPLQGITSMGFGAGITFAIAHPRWAFESGLVYSEKSFNPGRELTIGGVVDNSNVEFETMRMQLVSLPLQFRYRFEPKGRLKVYALTGFGFHVIAQSDIDVMIDYNFSSLMEGENPNNNPSLARTIRESKRVSDDFRKKAPFSTKSFISANLGLGLEYLLTQQKTLFLQAAYQYQIPNLRFSNHNGKHLLSVSLQAGVRTPLGS